jgi:hypothetical protein
MHFIGPWIIIYFMDYALYIYHRTSFFELHIGLFTCVSTVILNTTYESRTPFRYKRIGVVVAVTQHEAGLSSRI